MRKSKVVMASLKLCASNMKESIGEFNTEKVFSVTGEDGTIYFLANKNKILAMAMLRPVSKRITDSECKYFRTRAKDKKPVSYFLTWRDKKEINSAGFAFHAMFSLVPAGTTLLSDPLESNEKFWNSAIEHAIKVFNQVFLFQRSTREHVEIPYHCTLNKHAGTEWGQSRWFDTVLIGISR